LFSEKLDQLSQETFSFVSGFKAAEVLAADNAADADVSYLHHNREAKLALVITSLGVRVVRTRTFRSYALVASVDLDSIASIEKFTTEGGRVVLFHVAVTSRDGERLVFTSGAGVVHERVHGLIDTQGLDGPSDMNDRTYEALERATQNVSNQRDPRNRAPLGAPSLSTTAFRSDEDVEEFDRRLFDRLAGLSAADRDAMILDACSRAKAWGSPVSLGLMCNWVAQSRSKPHSEEIQNVRAEARNLHVQGRTDRSQYSMGALELTRGGRDSRIDLDPVIERLAETVGPELLQRFFKATQATDNDELAFIGFAETIAEYETEILRLEQLTAGLAPGPSQLAHRLQDDTGAGLKPVWLKELHDGTSEFAQEVYRWASTPVDQRLGRLEELSGYQNAFDCSVSLVLNERYIRGQCVSPAEVDAYVMPMEMQSRALQDAIAGLAGPITIAGQVNLAATGYREFGESGFRDFIQKHAPSVKRSELTGTASDVFDELGLPPNED